MTENMQQAGANGDASTANGCGTDNGTGPRTGPIVWGALVLVFCAYVVQRTIAPASIDSAGWIAATVIGLGALLLIVGIGVIVGNRRR